MSNNPYQAPQMAPEVVGVLSGKREDLKAVAVYQKGIIVCILIYFGVLALQAVIPADLRLIALLAFAAIGIASTAFVILLAIRVYGTALGIVFGVMALVPCLGLLMLVLINGKATGILRQNGVKVGFLGADLSAFS